MSSRIEGADSSFVMVSVGQEPPSFMRHRSNDDTPMSEVFVDLVPVNPTMLHTGRTQTTESQASWIHPRHMEGAEADDVTEEFTTRMDNDRVAQSDTQETSEIGEYLDPLTFAADPLASTATVRSQSVSAPLSSAPFAQSHDDMASTETEGNAPPAVYGYSSHALNNALGAYLVFTTSNRCRKVELMLELEPTEAEELS